MATLLKPATKGNERPTLPSAPSSGIEREVLEALCGPAGHHPSLQEVRSRLLPFLTELEIQTTLMSLLNEGVVDMVYTSDGELGFVLSPRVR